MRIESNLPVNEAVQSERTANVAGQSANSASKTRGSQVSESGVTLNTQELRATLEQTPDIRQEKVAALRKAMQDGTYHVSNQDLANAMFNHLVAKK